MKYSYVRKWYLKVKRKLETILYLYIKSFNIILIVLRHISRARAFLNCELISIFLFSSEAFSNADLAAKNDISASSTLIS